MHLYVLYTFIWGKKFRIHILDISSKDYGSFELKLDEEHLLTNHEVNYLPASVAQLDAPSDWRPGGHGFSPRRGLQQSFIVIDHEIFSTVILSLPLIQEGQLSVSGERMCTILVNRLED